MGRRATSHVAWGDSKLKAERGMDDSHRHERFMQLFLPVQRGLYGFLRTLIPNSADAEDVLQAAAAVMWERFDDFDPGTRFDYWAYHIARIQALRHLKDRKRSRLVFSEAVLGLLADHSVAVCSATRDVMDALELCVEQLSEQHRRMLQLRFETGATNRSVAAILGCSEATVSRALAQIYGNLMGCIQRNTVVEKQGGRQ
jgi:RNA polymerase sigma-70 factor, ECF subfamily